MITQAMINRLEQKRRKAQTKLSDELSVHINDNGDAVFYNITGYTPIRAFVLTKEELDALSQEMHGLLDQVDKLT